MADVTYALEYMEEERRWITCTPAKAGRQFVEVSGFGFKGTMVRHHFKHEENVTFRNFNWLA